MKQLDIKNFDANMHQFYLDCEVDRQPLLEGYLQLQYPRDMHQPMDQKAFNDYAKLVFIHIDPKEVQKTVSTATNIIINMALPHIKERS